ncbi:MAG: NADH-quinone oxidoreductase subunit L [Chloroflexota bacterium]|nr:NADH-quinone oxidoreductase subunit L [Chloroflexota bacterium]
MNIDDLIQISNLAILVPLLPMASFVVLTVLGLYKKSQIASSISIASIFASFIVSLLLLASLLSEGNVEGNWTWMSISSFTFDIGYTVDPISVLMALLVTSVSLSVQIYSISYMSGDPRYGWYYAAHSIFASSMLALVLTNSLLFLYISWELVGLSSFLLIGFWYEKRSAAEAAKKAFITTRFGDVGLLIAIIMLYLETGTFHIQEIVSNLGMIDDSKLTLIAFLLFLGAMGKSAQIPFHIWLPDAMEGPTPVSALIHAATMVAAGVFLVARLFEIFILQSSVLWFICLVGVSTSILAGFMALGHIDFKKILAYSTVSQLGLMFVALGASGLGHHETHNSPAAGLFHLVTHGYFKALLFLVAGVALHSIHKSSATIYEVRGMRINAPITSIAMLIGALCLIGIPPFSGFFSKEMILAAPLEIGGVGGTLLFLAVLFSCFLSAIYMTRLVLVVLQGDPLVDQGRVTDPPFAMILPIIVLTGTSIISGIVLVGPFNILGFISEGLSFHVDYVLASLSIVIGVGGIIIGLICFNKTDKLSPDVGRYLKPLSVWVDGGFYFDKVTNWMIQKGTLAFANLVAVFDRKIINDLFVDGIGMSPNFMGGFLRVTQTGYIAHYVTILAVSVVILFGIATLA